MTAIFMLIDDTSDNRFVWCAVCPASNYTTTQHTSSVRATRESDYIKYDRPEIALEIIVSRIGLSVIAVSLRRSNM